MTSKPSRNGVKPAVIVISSHVVRGTVGNRAAAFALEVLGFPVWIVPTVTLPWHPGHGPSHRVIPEKNDFETVIGDLCNAPWLGEVGAVLSGYLGHADQVPAVASLVDAVRNQNSEALYVLDPVMGDAPDDGEGRLYVSEEQGSAIRDELLPRADMIAPNPFELGWLSHRDTPRTHEALREAAILLGTKFVMGTSAPAMMKDHIGNMLIENGNDTNKTHLCEHRRAVGPPNGLGDLASALMLGNYLNSGDAVEALRKTSASLYEVMMIASKAKSNELMLEASIGSLINPRTAIDARLLHSPRPKR